MNAIFQTRMISSKYRTILSTPVVHIMGLGTVPTLSYLAITHCARSGSYESPQPEVTNFTIPGIRFKRDSTSQFPLPGSRKPSVPCRSELYIVCLLHPHYLILSLQSAPSSRVCLRHEVTMERLPLPHNSRSQNIQGYVNLWRYPSS